ncbi:MAG: TldD/PmbA family protein [Candidatus Bathyarchaeota archaeon]|nr:TldD/PmbA family protein [Candidatus Bathyarchaeota archaeon]
MFEIIEKSLESKEASRASLVQLRGQKRTMTLCTVLNNVLESFSRIDLSGVSARTLIQNRSWGFSSTNRLKKESVEQTLKTAVALASASARNKPKEAVVKEPPAQVATVKAKVKKSFEKASLEDIKEIPFDACRGALEAGAEVASAKATFLAVQDQKWFASSEGSRIYQESTRLLLFVDVIAKCGSLYCPASENLGHTGGLELFDMMPPASLGKDVAERAVKLLSAKPPPSGKFQVILHPTICATLLHEAIGHPLEADLAMEGGGFGGYVSKPVMSKLVTIYDDGVVERGLGYLPYDDEGIKSSRTFLVRNGVLESFMHDRTSAAAMNVSPTGNAHAWDYSVEPLIRQTNIGIEKGDFEEEEMLEDIKEGLFIQGTFGGQADASADFTFGFQNAYWIRHGKLAEMTRGANLSGNAIAVFKTVDAVSKEVVLRPGACGKGQFAIQGRVVPAVRCEILVGGAGS